MSKVACLHGTSEDGPKIGNYVNGVGNVTALNGSTVLQPKKVVVVGKMTRYEFEKHRFTGYTEEQFKNSLASRGSDYDALLTQHNKHLQTLSSIVDVLKQRGIDFQLRTRGKAYTPDIVDWADAIITAGGDGTFLSAASKIRNKSKPLIGINTDPDRSEGHLCLPPKYTKDFGKALDKLATGNFRWLWRQRIRVTMTGRASNFRPIDNGDILQSRMRDRASSFDYKPVEKVEINQTEPEKSGTRNSSTGQTSQVLPILALNEVFIGESLAAVPSYYDLQVDGSNPEEQKSSGLVVCTGTGSTAWSYNICRLHTTAVRRILEIAKAASNSEKDRENGQCSGISESFVDKVTQTYSKSFIYAPDEPMMLYSGRDPMENRVFKCSKCNGFANKLVIRSRCWDAALSIDGETSFTFNDGAVATMEIIPDDALCTVLLDDDPSFGIINKHD